MFPLHVKRLELSLRLSKQGRKAQGEQKPEDIREGASATDGMADKSIAGSEWRAGEPEHGSLRSDDTTTKSIFPVNPLETGESLCLPRDYVPSLMLAGPYSSPIFCPADASQPMHQVDRT
jgi:hypothetical protein